MLGRVLVTAMAVVGAMGLVAPGASAQETSGVYGWVWFDRDQNRSIDPTDAPRAGFTVAVHEVATGVDRTAVTNAEGYFSLDGLPLGAYDVTADDDGYRSVNWPTMRVDLIGPRPQGTYFPQVGGRLSPSGAVGTQYRAPGSEWYTDSGFVGTTRPVSAPFELWAAGWAASIDAGFVVV